jgi:hypothetical protein
VPVIILLTSGFSLDDVYSSEFQFPIIYYRLITAQKPEFIMDRQTDTIAILRFMLFERQRKNRSDLDRGPLKGKESKVLAMLDWIVACFVTEPVGDVVATAVSAEQGRITFYIAANRGQSRDQDRKNGETFKQLLRETIVHKSIVQQIMKVVSPIIYRRLVRKKKKST